MNHTLRDINPVYTCDGNEAFGNKRCRYFDSENGTQFCWLGFRLSVTEWTPLPICTEKINLNTYEPLPDEQGRTLRCHPLIKERNLWGLIAKRTWVKATDPTAKRVKHYLWLAYHYQHIKKIHQQWVY